MGEEILRAETPHIGHWVAAGGILLLLPLGRFGDTVVVALGSGLSPAVFVLLTSAMALISGLAMLAPVPLLPQRHRQTAAGILLIAMLVLLSAWTPRLVERATMPGTLDPPELHYQTIAGADTGCRHGAGQYSGLA